MLRSCFLDVPQNSKRLRLHTLTPPCHSPSEMPTKVFITVLSITCTYLLFQYCLNKLHLQSHSHCFNSTVLSITCTLPYRDSPYTMSISNAPPDTLPLPRLEKASEEASDHEMNDSNTSSVIVLTVKLSRNGIIMKSVSSLFHLSLCFKPDAKTHVSFTHKVSLFHLCLDLLTKQFTQNVSLFYRVSDLILVVIVTNDAADDDTKMNSLVFPVSLHIPKHLGFFNFICHLFECRLSVPFEILNGLLRVVRHNHNVCVSNLTQKRMSLSPTNYLCFICVCICSKLFRDGNRDERFRH